MHLIEGLSTCPSYVLDYNVAVDEVGADPGWVEDRPGPVEEDHAHHVVANVTLLVHL